MHLDLQAQDQDSVKRERTSYEAGLWRGGLILLAPGEAWPGDTEYWGTGAGREPGSALILPLQFTEEETGLGNLKRWAKQDGGRAEQLRGPGWR